MSLLLFAWRISSLEPWPWCQLLSRQREGGRRGGRGEGGREEGGRREGGGREGGRRGEGGRGGKERGGEGEGASASQNTTRMDTPSAAGSADSA